MIAIARTQPAFPRRHALQLAAALIVGIGIGSAAGAGVTERRPTDGAPAVAAAPTQHGTTSASEQYRSPYASSSRPAASTTASEQYRAAYTGGE